MCVENFNEIQIDAIGEIMNISLGASATAVSTMLGSQVSITTPKVSVLGKDEFEFKRLQPAVGVEISYNKGLYGRNLMMFSREDVRLIVGILMGMEIPKEDFILDEMNRSAICEVMNQMMGASATSLSEFLGKAIDISTPVSFDIDNEEGFKSKYFEDGEKKVIVSFKLEVEDKIHSEFINIMSASFVSDLLEPFMGKLPGEIYLDTPSKIGRQENAKNKKSDNVKEDAISAESSSKLSQEEINKLMSSNSTSKENHSMSQEEINNLMSSNSTSKEDHTMSQDEINNLMSRDSSSEGNHTMSQDEINKLMSGNSDTKQSVNTNSSSEITANSQTVPGGVYAEILNNMQKQQMMMMQMMQNMQNMQEPKTVNNNDNAGNQNIIKRPDASEFSSSSNRGSGDINKDMLMHVPLEISVEIGRTKKHVKDILDFTQGSLVVLDKMAGEQADIFVNGQCIAKGDIVVVEDNFGIRITEIVTKNILGENQV